MRAAPVLLVSILLPSIAPTASAAPDHGAIEARYDDWVRADEPIALAVGAGGSRLAVFIGVTDVTDLFRRTADGLVYRPELVPLPPGESEIAVYAVEDGWREVGRLPLRVERKGGIRKVGAAPRLDLESSALLDDDAGREETGFGSVSGQFDLGIDVERTGTSLGARVNVVGVTEVEQALRFAVDGERAPKADLSSYRLAFTRGAGSLEIGHLVFGDSRHLISGFASRGIKLQTPIGGGLDVGLAAVNGTSIVGWDNLLGVSRSDHRVFAGSLGIDLLPAPSRELRLEATALDASVLPLAGFNQGVISDAETSDGWSLRLVGQTADGRLRVDGSFSESTFTNPADPLLSLGEDLVPVEEETRSARYLDLDLRLIENAGLGGRHTADLGLAVRHERVEPLYRTAGSYAQADVERNAVDLSGRLGPVSATLSASRAEDNLDDVPSILTTRTDRRGLNLSLPLADLIGDQEGATAWAPSVIYSLDRTHQRGIDLPVNSGFDESHVPDQVSLSQNLGLAWSWHRWNLGYALGLSDQDNRQTGREEADFSAVTHGVSVGILAHRLLDLRLDWAAESATSEERNEVETTQRYGLSVSSPITRWLALSCGLSQTVGDFDPGLRESESTSVDLQASLRLERASDHGHGARSQLFLRYAYQRSVLRDPAFALDEATRFWSLTSGVNLSFF